MVRAQVSVFRCPEGTIGYVKAILPECNGPAVVIEVYPGDEIAVSGRDYPFFFEEGDAPDATDPAFPRRQSKNSG